MFIEFCHHSVGTLIRADKVSFDGHEVTNLISADERVKCAGYIADHFVRPPVLITLQFPCNIQVYRIIINPVIGQQKSCEIKLFTATKIMRDSWLYDNPQNKANTDNLLFNFIGAFKNENPAEICFENKQFGVFRGNVLQEFRDPYPFYSTLSSRHQGGLTNISHLNILIVRSSGSKAVAIKSLQVWGVPAFKVPGHVKNKLSESYRQALSQPMYKEFLISNKCDLERSENQVSQVASESSNTCMDNELSIPDDFLDALTYELMTVPVLLPCGRNVDMRTMETFINTEASWGRPPSDPFTGVPFTATAQAITNSALKARIDQYVLKHSDVLAAPRTLGRVPHAGLSQLRSSRLTDINAAVSMDNKQVNNQTESVQNPCLEIDTKDTAIKINTATGIETIPVMQSERRLEKTSYPHSCKAASQKRKYVGNQTLGSAKKSCMLQVQTSSKESQISKTTAIQSTDRPGSKSDHTRDLSSSLDSALSSALGGLPSFSCGPSSIKSTVPDDFSLSNKQTKCVTCKTVVLDSGIVKYKIPCGHLVCRTCIGNNAVGCILCAVCKEQYPSGDIVRVFSDHHEKLMFS